MMTKRSILLTAAALLMSAGTAVAAPQLPHQGAKQAQAPHFLQMAQTRISASKAKSIALSRVKGGEYVDLRLNGGIYIVRVRAPGGRIVDVHIDAATGRVK